MADKIEYSRMLVKRTAQTGEVPTIPPITAVTLNQMIPTDLFVGEFFLNETDDLLWVRTDNGILPISLSGSTGTTLQTLTQVLFQGNTTNGYNIEVSNGDTIIFQGIPSGVTSTILGLDASGNTITTTGGGGSQSLDDVLSYGNTTGIFDIVVNNGQTIQYLGLSSGSTSTILGLDASGNTITTTITDNDIYTTGGTITYINSNGTLDLFDNSGNTISITGLTDVYSTGGTYSTGTLTIDKNDGTSFNVSGLFTGYTSVVESLTTGTGLSGDTTTGNITLINTAPDQVVSISGGTNISVTGTYPSFAISATGLTTPDLSQVLAQGNTTSGNDIVITSGDTIQSVSGENIIDLEDNGYLSFNSTYSLGGFNYYDEIKMNADAPSDGNIEISSFNLTNTTNTNTTYRPDRIDNFSFDSLGNFTQTTLDNSGFTIDLSFVSAGYFTINGLITGSATDLLGIDSNNRVVPVSTSSLPDIFSTGGTFSAGTITINRNDGNSFNITGITAGVSSVNVGTGLSGNSTTGDITLINTAPDQVVSISGGSNISATGTYPNFTIAATGLTGDNLWTSGSSIGTVATVAGNHTVSAGQYNLLAGSGNTVVSGAYNTLIGYDNTSTGNSHFVGGLQNSVSGSNANFVFGLNNNINTTLGRMFVFGNNNSANTTGFSYGDGIFGWQNSLSGDSYFNFITGNQNNIYDSRGSAILGGTGNTINNFDHSVILGGQGITATVADMVYVPNLTIVSATTGTSISSLGIDSTGKVITTTTPTDYYVTGGTFSTSGGTLTLERQNGSVSITGFTANVGCLGITIDGGGSAITTGVVGSLIVPYACVIDCWGIIADQSGSTVIDVWKGSSPLSIPTSAAQSIAGSEKPTLSSQQINTDLNLTTWTKNLAFGDVLVFNVDSATTVERVTLQIKVIKL